MIRWMQSMFESTCLCGVSIFNSQQGHEQITYKSKTQSQLPKHKQSRNQCRMMSTIHQKYHRSPFLSRPNPVTQPSNDSPGLQIMQGQNIIPTIGQPIPIVPAALIVTQQLVSQQAAQYFGRASVTEVGRRSDEGGGHQRVRFHARFDRGENAEVLAGHCAHYGWVELHSLVCGFVRGCCG